MLRKGLSYVNKVSMGGGKSLVKSKSYLCLLFLSVFTVFVMFSQDFVNAAPRKASVKRAGNTKKAKSSSSSSSSSSSAKSKAKRAAVGGNNKRAGTTRANTTRAQTRGKPGSSAVKAAASTPVVAATTTSASDVCPVGTILKRKLDNETGDYTYYSAKNTECSLPEGDVVSVMVWEKANKSNYPKTLQVKPSWVAESEASFLTCVSGYVERTVDKVKTCVSALEICPINEIVEKSGKVYISPYSQEECMAPDKAMVRNVKGEENLLSTVADDDAYIFECPANYYPVADSETSLKVKCEMCPAGTSSAKGASSVNDCSDGSAVVEPVVEEEPVAVAVVEPQVNTVVDDSVALAKLRIKKVEGSEDDYTCIDGWTNHWQFKSGRLGNAKIMDKDGKIKNVVDRNAYGKNKRGCPIKLDKYMYFDYGHVYYQNGFSYIYSSSNIGVKPCPSGSINSIASQLGVLKEKMISADIDNTGVNGWTEEEYEAWNGYRPVIGSYYDLSKYDGKITNSCGSNAISAIKDKVDGKYRLVYVDDIDMLIDMGSNKNLFNYWN